MYDFFDSIPAQLYQSIYVYGLFGLCVLVIFKYIFSADNNNIVKVQPFTQIFPFILIAVVILFIGLRPINWHFMDMIVYAHTYNNILDGYQSGIENEKGEWLFYLLSNSCKRVGMIDKDYFLVLSFLYFGLMALVCWRLMRDNMFVALLFCLISLSCFSYGTNGLRNGVAASIMMLAITFLKRENKLQIVIAISLMVAAIGFHRSMMLPSVCSIVAFLFVDETEKAVCFWIASIFISLVAGSYITQIIGDMGFDDRFEHYSNLDEYGEVMEKTNYNVGFRWDFIMYSIFPIIMVWYVTIKRNFRDTTYNIIAITYILANAFWLMVIRSNQSNRFAYLSWFLYPLVIAYPLLRMNIWEDQDKKTAIILLAYAGFTLLMFLVG